MIQIITYDLNKYKDYPDKLYKISKLGEIQALDDFEICVIDLTSENLWRYNDSQPTNINDRNDLLTLKEAIINCKITTVLIILPQNEDFYYNRESKYINGSYQYRLSKYIQLKDNKDNLMKIINNNLLNIEDARVTFEKTKTIIEGKEVEADFNFINCEEKFKTITFSKNSNKVTTIQKGKIFLTTLNILTSNDVLSLFIKKYCKPNNEKEEMPEWIQNITFYNDEQLEEDKNSNNEKIQKLKEKNIKIEEQLKKNLEYKSILYTNGDELVKVVLEILDEILEYDSSEFVDEKREDFLIKKGDITFVGEIKGLSSAVKNENVSQLDVHVQSYIDDLQQEGTEEKVKGLLIINHQRNKPIEERQGVHEHQIKLATRNESLIIETITLLKIYEKYKLGDMTKEECKKIFKDNIGLLEI